ncbi:MAG: hypothetical protein FWF08_04660 [Oscillospiraceae bacterium]|nr:hypothetical protein [Oscillospiraceae bacterium]
MISEKYKITNPYAAVDWDTWKQYKANLHSHTLYSDAKIPVSESVNAYYEQGYDILATADHGVIHRGWDVIPKMVPIIGMKWRKTLEPLSGERYLQVTTGSDRGGRPMMEVDRAIELNTATLRKNHVNGFFCEYGQGKWGREGDYETAVAGVHKAGGVSFINHPGDFIKSHKDFSFARDMKNIKFFGNIFLKYDSCIGMEVFNRIDSVTKGDRILWDGILQYAIPRGRAVWGFANDDSHELKGIGLTAEMIMMPDLSNTALRSAMESGAFFACAKIARNEMGGEFCGTGEYAAVKRIIADDECGTITIKAENADIIEWVANEKALCTGETINLGDFTDDITCYVRAQIKNEGGIVLTQPFICDDGSLGRNIAPDDWKRPLTGKERVQRLGEKFMNLKIIQAVKLIGS